jgi:large subunit ribosomal protein L24
MRKIKKGDDVIVIAGKDKGKRGAVLTVQTDDRVVVQNVNMVKRHTKPNPVRGGSGGIIEKEAPIHVSNVALFNPATGKGDRAGIKILENGKRVRQFKSNGEVVDI